MNDLAWQKTSSHIPRDVLTESALLQNAKLIGVDRGCCMQSVGRKLHPACIQAVANKSPQLACGSPCAADSSMKVLLWRDPCRAKTSPSCWIWFEYKKSLKGGGRGAFQIVSSSTSSWTSRLLAKVPMTVQVGSDRFRVEGKKNLGHRLLIMKRGKVQVLQVRADRPQAELFMLGLLAKLRDGLVQPEQLKEMKENWQKDRSIGNICIATARGQVSYQGVLQALLYSCVWVVASD